MKKLLVLVVVLAVLIVPIVASAGNIEMIGMKRVGHGILIIWHPDNTVSEYVVLVKNGTTKLVKSRSLDIKDYPLKQNVCVNCK